ncbi:MAG: hypothetical protein PUB12_00640 [[Clostridium] aminophilum]|uniref:hypothetical protein n=1 Tax=[Clostridium] aminophilum TaxID=1526 RepID=UPI0026EFE38E|nr:hypothetical protein [[Clostridium] aminophilum]MDD6195402.1 hypothetical protein [[Clostridium] aminophilum]
MKRFRQISAEEMLKLIPMAPNMVILEENGEGWYWLNDYVADRFANATILIEEPEITRNTEETPKKQEEKKAVKEEKQMTTEEKLYEKISSLSASIAKKSKSVDPKVIDEVVEKYQAGQSIRDISEEMKIQSKQVKEILIDQEIPLNISKVFWGDVRRAAESGESLEKIADYWHTDVDHIQEIVDGGKG